MEVLTPATLAREFGARSSTAKRALAAPGTDPLQAARDYFAAVVETVTKKIAGNTGGEGAIALDAYALPREPCDLFRPLYQSLIPRRARHAQGEYYTPPWLAALTLDRLGYDGRGSLLDPACGSGVFLVEAIRRARECGAPLDAIVQSVAGTDTNPLAVAAARANYLLALGDLLPPGVEVVPPVRRADATHPAGERFDFVAGNPPWVNWERLSEAYRQETRPLWERYGLFPHGGMDAILGKGKKDLAMLITYAALDLHLKPGGRLGFVITQSALKTAGAGDGFRRFRLDDGTPVCVRCVDDMSAINPFEGAANRTAVIVIEKGRPTAYPVPYTTWRGARPREDDALEAVMQRTARVEMAAEPVDPNAPGSPWLTGAPAALRAARKLTDASDYTAHAGAYTGGANGVYWLEVVEDEDYNWGFAPNPTRGRGPHALTRSPENVNPAPFPNGGDREGMPHSEGVTGPVAPCGVWGGTPHLHVRNMASAGKREVEQVEAMIEAALVYPLLRSGEVTRWRAEPGAHILMAQDPAARRGYDAAQLRETLPLTYAYLSRFEDVLLARRDRGTRGLIARGAPFYSMFGVGAYTFAPWKVVWPRIGAHAAAAVLAPRDGRPVVPQETVTLVACESPDEAHFICAAFNAAPFDYALQAFSQRGGKSFGTPGVLARLRIPRFDPADPVHRGLADCSRRAHEAASAGRDVRGIEAEAGRLAAQLWHLTDVELKEIIEGLAAPGA